MGIIQRIQDGNMNRKIERAVQCENRLKDLSNIAVHRRMVYDSTRSKYLVGVSTIDEQEQVEKGGSNLHYLSFLRGRILDKLSEVERDYRSETLKNTKEALEIKGQLAKLYAQDGVEKSVKETLNQDRLGAAYDTILEAFKQKKIDKEKLKEVRSATESKLNRQVAYSDMIVMDALGRVLLLKRSEGDGEMDGKWGLPGGHVDPGETHLEAGVRELAEEAVVNVTPETCSKVAELNNSKAHIEYFRTYVDYIPVIGINVREHSDYEWVDPVNLTKYDLIGDLADTLKEVFKYALDPKVVEVKKAFNTILTAYFNGKVDEELISNVSEIYLEKAEKNKGEKKVGKVMREYKEGTLRSGSGEKVTSREQAIAIALSEARKVQKSDETQTEEVNIEKGKKVKDLAKKYHEWNTQGGEPAYKKPSEASVLEFLQNNYEDLSEDDETKKGLLNELNTTSLSKAYNNIKDYANKIIKGEEYIERLSPEEERGCIEGGRRNVEATILCSTVKGSDSEKREDIERAGKGKIQIQKALEVLELAYQQGQIPLDVLEKARHGVYADNAQNRELHRVGQPYGKKGEEDEKSGKEGKSKVVNADDKKQKDQPQSLPEQAKQASGSALEQAAKEAKDPDVRTAAHQELKRRENEEQVQEGDEKKGIDNKEDIDLKGISRQLEEIYEEDPNIIEELNNKNTLDNYDIDNIKIPQNIEENMFWQEKLVEHIFNELGVDYVKHGSKTTSSSYYELETKSGDSFKLRVADHKMKYGSDGNIEFDDNTTPEDIVQKLKEILPDDEILKKKETIATSYKNAKERPKDKLTLQEKRLIEAVEKVIENNKVEKSVQNDTWERWL